MRKICRFIKYTLLRYELDKTVNSNSLSTGVNSSSSLSYVHVFISIQKDVQKQIIIVQKTREVLRDLKKTLSGAFEV